MSKTLIKKGIIIPMDGKTKVLKDHCVLIEGDVISALGKMETLVRNHQIDEVVDATNKAVMPGIINTHTHVAPSPILRGQTEDRTDFYQSLVVPLEEKIKPEEAYYCSLLSCIELVKYGTTCINDLWSHMDRTAQAVKDIGLRAVLTHEVRESALPILHPNDVHYNRREGEKRIRESIDFFEKWHRKGDGRITCCFGPFAPSACSSAFLRKTASLARTHGVNMHTHALFSPVEIEWAKNVHHKKLIQILLDLGCLGPDVLLTHLLYISREEINIVKSTGTKMLHCPLRAAKNARYPPMDIIYQTGIDVALGTDFGMMDPFDCMRFALMIARMNGFAKPIITAYDALEMMTIKAARILGLGEEIGSIEPAKKADLVLIDLNQPHLQPLKSADDIIPTLVYNASGKDVDTVFINGEKVMEERHFLTVNEAQIMRRTLKTAKEICHRIAIHKVKC